MTREEVMQVANDRGWYTHIRSSDDKWHVMSHQLYPFVIELWPDTNEFMFRYNSGLFVFQSSKAGSFTNDEHFNRFFREMRFMTMEIREAKDIYMQRLEDRRKKKNDKKSI